MKTYLLKLIKNDMKIWRFFTRKIYYHLENIEFYKTIPIREVMLKNIFIDQEMKKKEIKDSNYKWIMIMKPKYKKRENFEWFFDK